MSSKKVKRNNTKEFIINNRSSLENNSNVLSLGKTIQYAPEFKIKAVEMKRSGISLKEIFESNGFPYDNLRSYNMFKQWSVKYDTLGIESFFKESRGRNLNGKSGRPKKEEITVDEKVLIQEKIIEAQRLEIEALKKQLWQGRKVKKINETEFMPTQLVFQFIDDLKGKTTVSIQTLCKYFKVSRSGYYKWVKNADKRVKREQQDKSDFDLINFLWSKNKEYGYPSINMHLKNDLGVIMNPKKVYRLMKKYGICSTVRKKNPYAHLSDSYKQHYYFDNVLDRQFDVKKPDTVYATDITYLIWGNNRYYLSVVKDLGSSEAPVWKVSKCLGIDLSLDVIDKLANKLGKDKMKDIMIHSDQGVHYTNPSYVTKLKGLGVIQSMSRRGNCLDNAKMETFFGHFKDECKYQEAKSFEDLVIIIDEYMNYYNNQRYQWKLKKMAPVQYRSHLLAA